MAKKCVYMYKIIMGYGRNTKEVVYAYARNATAAREGAREAFRDKKYDHYTAVMFGESDLRVHPALFELMSHEEVNMLKNNRLGEANKYSLIRQAPQRKSEGE